MKRILLILLLVLPVLAQTLEARRWWTCSVTMPEWVSNETGARVEAFMQLPETDSVAAVMFAFQNMNEETLFKMDSFRERMARAGVALVWIVPGCGQEWDVSTGVQENFNRMLSALATESGHPEIADAPLIPFGHSAQATMPWNFAAWNPERTLCVISYHGDAPRTNLCGYGRANIEWGRTRNIDGIPGLMVMGEYEWWDARLRPALAFRMMYPGSCISFLGDAGRGHFDLSGRTAAYMAEFIEEALATRLTSNGLMPVDAADGWLAQAWHPGCTDRTAPAPWKDYSGCRHEAFWFFNREMAEAAEARYAETAGKQPRWIGFADDAGNLFAYNPAGHCKINVRIKPDASDTFTLHAVFTDSTRTSKTAGMQTPIKVRYVSGPAEAVNDSTFRVDREHPTWRNPRRRAKVTLCAEAPSDTIYKETVQEIEVTIE